MADTIKVKVLRAVGGFEVGASRDLSEADAKRLAARGVVEIAKADKAPANKTKAKK